MFVDPVGRTYERAPLHEPSVRVRTAFTTDVRTLYVRIGDVVGTAAAGATLLLVLGAGWIGLDFSNKNHY